MKTLLRCAQFFLLLLVPSLLWGQPSGTESQQPEKAEIAQIENRWLEAIETSDVAALDSILADDFVRPVPEASQFITKSQLLDHLKTHKPSSAGSKRIENLVITLYGATAVARGNVVGYNSSGQVVSRNLFTDVFVSRDGRWQAVSAQENATWLH